MISREDVLNLLREPESFRIEKTVSVTNTDKFCEAICAFSNDMPDSRKNGYLLIGVNDDGSLSGLKITDEIQKNIANIRTSGNILPQPNMTVQPFYFDDGDVLVVEVIPSYAFFSEARGVRVVPNPFLPLLSSRAPHCHVERSRGI